METPSITITRVEEATDTLVDAINVLIPQLGPAAQVFTKSELEKMCNDSSTYLFVAKDEELVVGMLTLITYHTPTGARGYIEDVVVDERARGKGVGKLLMQTAINTAKDLQLEFVALTSRPERDIANKLYLGMGFQKKETNFYRLFLKNTNFS